MSRPEQDARGEIVEGLREVRDQARQEPQDRATAPNRITATPGSRPLSPLGGIEPVPVASSPDRDELNRAWDVSERGAEERGIFAPLRAAIGRLGRRTLQPFIERQVRMNSLQVKFDNELVQYMDNRMDRMVRHYDEVLGLHGKRMEEIDERHLILQQELVRHVHDLVERIDFVFESAEQNHLYLEGMLREIREELRGLAERLVSPPPAKR